MSEGQVGVNGAAAPASLASAVKQQLASPAATPMTTTTTTTTTWNSAVSHATTGVARVDLFYGAARGVAQERLARLLEASYAEDALHTLKIVAYLRDCRGGKGERQIGRWALAHLAETHPRALRHNLERVEVR